MILANVSAEHFASAPIDDAQIHTRCDVPYETVASRVGAGESAAGFRPTVVHVDAGVAAAEATPFSA